ncbi:glycosyltransferase [Leptospira yasudae]|nr:glycosyltransferase [Leptospira yasudae]TGK24922.1 glycosyltransferase [Leptospira yasudae]TGM05915.1 glycosyltransferase [Leptospira yasudae]
MLVFIQKVFYLLRQYQYYFFLYPSFRKIQKSEYSYEPLISILVPVYNTKLEHLNEMLRSVEVQSYGRWELILWDDASPKNEPGEFLKQKAAVNPKIRYFRAEKNGGISLATSNALEHARGEYIAFLDHDDKLTKDALSVIVDSLQNENLRPEFLYSDEIFQSKTFGVFSLSTKPDFSPEKLISHNYICHLVVVSRNLIQKMGGYREGYDGSQDHEFALRACRYTDRIRRLPYYLYEWRLHQESFSRTKAEICERSSKKAISEFYQDRSETLNNIVSGNYPFTYHPIRKLNQIQTVSIILLDLEGILENHLQPLVELIRSAPEFNLEILLPENISKAEVDPFKNSLEEWKDRVSYKTFPSLKHQELSTGELNSVAANASGEYLFFWNPLFLPKNKEWLYELLQHAQSKGVGAVCPILLNAKEELIYSSLLLGKNGFIGVAGNGITLSEAKIWSGEFIEKNVSAISRNSFLISRKVWNELNGLNESLQTNYWDVDLCLRLLEKGYRIVSNPFSIFVSSKKPLRSFQEFDPRYKKAKKDRNILIQKWGEALNSDRYYSPHSDLLGQDMRPKGFLHVLLYALYRNRWN